VPGPGTLRSSRPTPAFWRRCAIPAVLAAGFAITAPAHAQQQQPPPEESRLKADYLANFSRFVDWPAAPSSTPTPDTQAAVAAARTTDPFTICILGRDPFGPTLDNVLAGPSVDNRKLIARRISTHKDAPSCEILFIATSESAHLKEILNSVEKFPVLTVSDLPNFLANGGMIEFVVKEDKIRFAVNVSVAAKAGLIVSSQLLKVAAEIKKDPVDEPKP
jgi:hypothetical protein